MGVQDMTSEELAAVVRAINVTGISPSRDEQAYLEEAAVRLEKLDRIERWIRGQYE